MTGLLIHRGPDEAGFYEDDTVSLGVRRLNVVDLQTGSQPISNEDGTIQLVANCEIYDFEKTRSRLEGGHRFRTRSDAEVIVHLYEEYGLDLFDHLEGMYAFALWDRVRQRLVLGRDRFGIKPLFHTLPDAGGRFAFASGIAPLLTLASTSRDVDLAAIDDFFAYSYIPHPRTVYTSIRKLAPGSCLIAEGGAARTIEHWALELHSPSTDDEEALARLDSAIGSAVRRSLRSDVPVGAFLSGGLDSAAVVFHMAESCAAAVPTFALRFDDERYDEGPLALMTSRALGTEHHEIRARPADLQLGRGLMAHFGEPFADPSQIPAHLVCREARRSVTVLLSGDGGDEILGGYPAYCAAILAARIPPFLGSLRGAARWLPRLLPLTHPRLARTGERAGKFLSGARLRWDRRHLMWRTIMTSADRQAIYAPAVRAALASDGLKRDDVEWDVRLPTMLDELTRCQYLDIRTYLTDNCLAKIDRMSMATALEVRVPLLDLEVFRAAMRLPGHLRVRGLGTKVALRKIMKGRIPAVVLRAKKKGFPVPLASWFRGPLRPCVEQTLAPARIRDIPWLSPTGVSELVEQHMRGTANRERQIWSLLCFVHWHDQVHST